MPRNTDSTPVIHEVTFFICVCSKKCHVSTRPISKNIKKVPAKENFHNKHATSNNLHKRLLIQAKKKFLQKKTFTGTLILDSLRAVTKSTISLNRRLVRKLHLDFNFNTTGEFELHERINSLRS